MVEQKRIATLFRIERVNDDIEQLVPFDVVEGTYDEENCTFTTTDGKTYVNIEEAELPNVGYANTIEIGRLSNDSAADIESVKQQKLTKEKANRYFRFVSERNKIYEKIDSTFLPMVNFEGRKYKEITDYIREKEYPREVNMTPQEIVEKVKETIKGQDEAIATIATCIWATLNDRKLSKKQMLLIGPTGVGKTAIFKKLERILKIPLIIFSVPGLSQAGYEGRSTDEILKQIYFECDADIDRAEKSIVILDEIDKITFKDIADGAVSTIGVQNELLKIVEGCTRFVEIDDDDSFTINTSNIIFIATGAFQGLYENKNQPIGFGQQKNAIETSRKNSITTNDLIKYGLIRELIGRFPIQVELNPLTREIYREIILSSDESELLSHISFLEKLGIKVSNIEEIIDLIIDDAIAKEIGARGLVATISKLFLGVIYEIANKPGKYNEVIIGSNIINDPYDFELIEKKTKKRIKINKGV